MRLNRTELRLVAYLSQKVSVSYSEAYQDLRLSQSHFSKNINELIEKGFLEKEGKSLRISSNKFARGISNLLLKDESLVESLHDSGIPILALIISSLGTELKGIEKELNLTPPAVYPYVRNFINKQIIYKENNKLKFNNKIWSSLYDFILEYKEFEILRQFDKLPTNAKIYFESLNEVIFSLPSEIDFASKTAFSRYDDYGITLMGNEIFYRLDKRPERELDISTIFLDSLKIAGAKNEESARRRLYCYLFYRKNLSQLKDIKHPDIEIMDDIMKDKIDKEKTINFSSKEEIIDKAKDYDIKIQ